MILFSLFSAIPAGPPERKAQSKTVAMLYEKYADMIYRIAFVRTLSSADSEDILQEVFCRYLRALPEFTDEGHCRAWFIRTAINCSKNLLTSAWRRHAVFGEEISDAAVYQMEHNSTVYHAVMKLPAEQRTVVHLYYYEDCPVAEIASLTGLSQSAVKSRLFRAREALREQLKEDFDV